MTPTPSENSSSDSDSVVTARHGGLDMSVYPSEAAGLLASDLLNREKINHCIFISLSSTAWEDTLRDNLLNFASSAKGLLLLQQTGAMNECMSYMYARYEKKLQVILL